MLKRHRTTKKCKKLRKVLESKVRNADLQNQGEATWAKEVRWQGYQEGYAAGYAEAVALGRERFRQGLHETGGGGEKVKALPAGVYRRGRVRETDTDRPPHHDRGDPGGRAARH